MFNGFVWCGSRFGDSTPMRNASDSYEIPILIVSVVANPCKITANCQVRSVSLHSTCPFRLSNMSTHSYKDPNPTQIIFQRENKRNFGIASGCLRMNAYSTHRSTVESAQPSWKQIGATAHPWLRVFYEGSSFWARRLTAWHHLSID
jgi:hypothetical protein